mmetsp:Transcript_13047/g.9444  ORF Transcript_13047/g.9444 Transcript_13047/m.9444 type:complete len:111 (-) Transcript_13047:229-561(-)|eukprot:CAMPEP_0202963164 /NCGR_PEP_ID=MMETSP1396-20130829/7155_1 /ASSEMBLY_ACC=CAM_ASM_000872 /TAXON_ID= /ORGANISM="Pseudokeronopsis sp., Strain Brazil" /LENGTH=110 /DNA_ID=CAMNT_0049684155 /DNA_START=330 /DNA_END=662 /DNA_ORIENTATION=-
MNDEPSARGLSLEEVAEIQKHLANVPSHMIPSELKNIEIRMEREKREEHKNMEGRVKEKLQLMAPVLKYRLPQLVDRGTNYKRCEPDKAEEKAQKLRESSSFFILYSREN